MNKTYDVAVVGAGITGASTAYHLKTLGIANVALIERDGIAAGGTGKSAALVRQHYSNPLAIRLAKQSIELFRAMPEELGASGGYVRAGYFFLSPPDSLAGFRKNVAMQQSCGVDTSILSDDEIAERMPWLNPDGVAAVAFEPDGGYADPVRSTEAYAKAFQDSGGALILRTPVRALRRKGDRVIGILTDDGPIDTGCVVNAAGPWAHFLARSSDLDLPLRTVREQDTVWEARPDRPVPESSISNAVDAIYVRPLGDRRYVLGRGFPKEYVDVDPYNYKTTADEAFVSDVLERAERRFPTFAGLTRIDAYAALYDVTPDWYPFVGPRLGLEGYWDACGGSGHGFKIGPAIGRELAGWIANGTAADDFAQLSHDRIAAGNLFTQTYGGNRG